MNKKKLIREQLGVSLERFNALRGVSPPRKGWIRAIRDALGMTAKQLADRLGVAQQAVSRIERDELRGAVSIKTMRRVAESLDCVFVFGFVPKTSLEDTLRARARRVARRRLAQASHTMALEAQSVSAHENEKIFHGMVDDLLESVSSDLWDDKL